MGISPDYVLDKMQTYEISSLMEYGYYRNKDQWEQARLIAYVMAQVNSRKPIKPTDIIKFDWDGKREKEDAKPITKEQIEKWQKMAQSMIDNKVV